MTGWPSGLTCQTEACVFPSFVFWAPYGGGRSNPLPDTIIAFYLRNSLISTSPVTLQHQLLRISMIEVGGNSKVVHSGHLVEVTGGLVLS